MISLLILLVAGYVAFRCIEVFCKQPNGQYSEYGHVTLMTVALLLLISAVYIGVATLSNQADLNRLLR